MPSAAYREWLDAPAGLLEEIVEARAYAAMKDAIDRAASKDEIPQTRLAQLVQQIEFAIVEEDRNRDAAAHGD